MPSKPKRDRENDSSDRNRLPFEPSKSRKQTEKKEKKPSASAAKAVGSENKRTNQATAIPEAVSRRMVRRMALFTGIPTVFGMLTFLGSYFVVTRDLFPLPNSAVVLVSMGFFGLGVLGLSYGVLSASWDEDNPGSRVGWSEFTTNLGRMTDAWRAGKKS